MSPAKKKPAKATAGYWTFRIERTPQRRLIIEQFRKLHYKQRISDEEVVAFFCAMAFVLPAQISNAADLMVNYREAEGLTGDAPLDQLTGSAAAQWRKHIKATS